MFIVLCDSSLDLAITTKNFGFQKVFVRRSDNRGKMITESQKASEAFDFEEQIRISTIHIQYHTCIAPITVPHIITVIVT